MAGYTVAGVDWAGDGWLAVLFEDSEEVDCVLGDEFSAILECRTEFDQILIDIPIGLPEGEEGLERREELDSEARSITSRPSSVFPVPSREAAKMAYEEKNYESVVEQNEADLDKGLSWQSYYIAEGIGEVDKVLRGEEWETNAVVESHPELCFRAFKGEQLDHSKTSAAGVGERLKTLSDRRDCPEALLKTVTQQLIGRSEGAQVDDVLDAIVLGLTAEAGVEDELKYLTPDSDSGTGNLPMQMAYSADQPLSSEGG